MDDSFDSDGEYFKDGEYFEDGENAGNAEENIEINDDEEQIHSEDHEIEHDDIIITAKKRSWVWEYFSSDNISKKSRCSLCKTLITTSKGSTTGMSNHLRSKHKITKDSDNNNNQSKQRQLTLQEVIQNPNINVSLI